jgi:hypothetical protein
MITNIVLGIVLVAAIAALIDCQRKITRLDSENRNAHRLLSRYTSYILKLEAWIDDMTVQRDNLQSFYRYTLNVSKENQAKLADKLAEAYKANKVNGNGKNNGQNATQTATPSAGNTLASLGIISADEQRLIDQWTQQKADEPTMAKRIADRRAKNAAKTN